VLYAQGTHAAATPAPQLSSRHTPPVIRLPLCLSPLRRRRVRLSPFTLYPFACSRAVRLAHSPPGGGEELGAGELPG